MTKDELIALADEVFHLVADHLHAAGLMPINPEVSPIFATMIAAHYAMRGGGPALRAELLIDIDHAFDLADRRRRRQ